MTKPEIKLPGSRSRVQPGFPAISLVRQTLEIARRQFSRQKWLLLAGPLLAFVPAFALWFINRPSAWSLLEYLELMFFLVGSAITTVHAVSLYEARDGVVSLELSSPVRPVQIWSASLLSTAAILITQISPAFVVAFLIAPTEIEEIRVPLVVGCTLFAIMAIHYGAVLRLSRRTYWLELAASTLLVLPFLDFVQEVAWRFGNTTENPVPLLLSAACLPWLSSIVLSPWIALSRARTNPGKLASAMSRVSVTGLVASAFALMLATEWVTVDPSELEIMQWDDGWIVTTGYYDEGWDSYLYSPSGARRRLPTYHSHANAEALITDEMVFIQDWSGGYVSNERAFPQVKRHDLGRILGDGGSGKAKSSSGLLALDGRHSTILRTSDLRTLGTLYGWRVEAFLSETSCFVSDSETSTNLAIWDWEKNSVDHVATLSGKIERVDPIGRDTAGVLSTSRDRIYRYEIVNLDDGEFALVREGGVTLSFWAAGRPTTVGRFLVTPLESQIELVELTNPKRKVTFELPGTAQQIHNLGSDRHALILSRRSSGHLSLPLSFPYLLDVDSQTLSRVANGHSQTWNGLIHLNDGPSLRWDSEQRAFVETAHPESGRFSFQRLFHTMVPGS